MKINFAPINWSGVAKDEANRARQNLNKGIAEYLAQLHLRQDLEISNLIAYFDQLVNTGSFSLKIWREHQIDGSLSYELESYGGLVLENRTSYYNLATGTVLDLWQPVRSLILAYKNCHKERVVKIELDYGFELYQAALEKNWPIHQSNFATWQNIWEIIKTSLDNLLKEIEKNCNNPSYRAFLNCLDYTSRDLRETMRQKCLTTPA